jgi:hypothetical protein
LKQALVRLEGEQTKTGEAGVIPLPAVLVKTFKSVKIKEESVFDDRALRDEWSRAVVAAELPGLLIHDLRRSAIRNLIASGVPEKVAMSIPGRKTRAVFDRYHIVSTADASNAMKQVEKSFQNGESLVRGGHQPRAN